MASCGDLNSCLQGEDFFDYMDADEEKCEEATGNEGATMDRYRNPHIPNGWA